MIPKVFERGQKFTVPLWNKRPESFLREEFRKGPWSYRRGYQQRAPREEERAFGELAPLFRFMKLADLVNQDAMRFGGFDPASAARLGNALVSVAINPVTELRVITNMQLFRGSFDVINARIIESYHIQKWQLLTVENNGLQDQIIGALTYHNITLPVVGFLTGQNKAHPEHGVRGLAAEIANGAWALCMEDPYDTDSPLVDHLPECACAYHVFLQDLMHWPSPGRHYDLLMAWWFVRESLRGNVAGIPPREETQESIRLEMGLGIPTEEFGGYFSRF